jgi:hypothetical protein
MTRNPGPACPAVAKPLQMLSLLINYQAVQQLKSASAQLSMTILKRSALDKEVADNLYKDLLVLIQEYLPGFPEKKFDRVFYRLSIPKVAEEILQSKGAEVFKKSFCYTINLANIIFVIGQRSRTRCPAPQNIEYQM